MSFTSIPVIDFSAASGTDAEARRKLAAEVRGVCLSIGFFYVKNHGVPQEVVDKTFKRAEEFFHLPLEDKMKIDIEKSENFKGYTKLLGENVDPANRGDLHESFDLSSTPGNVWPEGLPGFAEDLTAYWDAVIALGQRMATIFAMALNLPEDYFEKRTDKSSSIMRLNYYPPQTGIVDDRTMGIGSHSDYELFTILAQDDVGGLQVLNRDKKWIDATPIPGTFVVNIADQLMRWTNDTFVSTLHRAINRSGRERYSIPLFFGSNADCVVEPMSTCVSEANPAKYPPVLAGEYVRGRLQATYPQHVNTTVKAAA